MYPRMHFFTITAAALALVAAAGCTSSSKPDVAPVGEVTGPAATTVAPWAASGTAPNSTVTICMFAGPGAGVSPQTLARNSLTSRRERSTSSSWPYRRNRPTRAHLQQLRSGSSTCDIVDQSTTNAGLINQYLEPLEPYMKQPSLFNADRL